jgi:hypothetical protein
MKEVFEQQ